MWQLDNNNLRLQLLTVLSHPGQNLGHNQATSSCILKSRYTTAEYSIPELLQSELCIIQSLTPCHNKSDEQSVLGRMKGTAYCTRSPS
jgi:hypothetical protein